MTADYSQSSASLQTSIEVPTVAPVPAPDDFTERPASSKRAVVHAVSSRLESGRGWIVLAAGILAGIWATYQLWLLPSRPGVKSPTGYYGYFDQSYYLLEARSLASGHLPTVHQYLYGLGFPLFGALAIKLGFQGDPFAPIDVLAFAAAISLTVLLGMRLRSLAFGLVAGLAVATATPLLSLVLVPWTTSVILISVLVALVVATTPGRLRWWHGLLLALCVGLAFASRYVDVVGPAAIAAFALLRPQGRTRQAWVVAIVGGALIVGAVLASQAVVLGSPLRTPYASHTRAGFGSDQSLKNYNIAWIPSDAKEALLTGRSNCNHAAGCTFPLSMQPPLLAQFPLAWLAPVGVVVLLRRRRTMPHAFLMVTTAGVSVLMTLFYLAYVAGGGGGLIDDSLRHFTTWFPLWTFLGLLGGIYIIDVLRGFPRGRHAAASGDPRTSVPREILSPAEG
jgi:hypothetical protein